MEKLDNFINKLTDYKIICQKICNKIKVEDVKIQIFQDEFTYIQILDKLEKTIEKLKALRTQDNLSYNLLSLDFENTIYVNSNNGNNFDSFFFKKQYNELINNRYPLPKNNNMFWEDLFLNEQHATLLLTSFPSDDICNIDGNIYKKFQSLLYIIVWLEDKVNYIYSKNKKVIKSFEETLLKNSNIAKKFESVSSNNIDIFLNFLSEMDEINETVESVKEVHESSTNLIYNLTDNSSKASTLIQEVNTAKEDTKELIKNNKNISTYLTTQEMSGTFAEAALNYNISKRWKLGFIFIMTIFLFWYSYDMLRFFNATEMTRFEQSPLVLIVYSIPRLFIFGIGTWVLKFLISNYDNDSNISLDFKHRQAVADVTPGFKKQLDDKEKQNDLVNEAFKVITASPNTNNSKKSDKIFYEKLVDILSNEEMKANLIKLLKLPMEIIKSKDKDKNDKEE